MFEEIRRKVEAAPRAALPAIAQALWAAFGEGGVSEAQAQALDQAIRSRLERPIAAARKPVGARPRSGASMERRRRWAASGRLPPTLAMKFSLAEQAALSVVAAEVAEKGACRLPIGHIAAAAGISETTVRNAIREARQLGLVSVEERRLARFRSDTNVVRILAVEWTSWLTLTRKGGGCKSPQGTSTRSSKGVKFGDRDGRRVRGCRARVRGGYPDG
jgi:hypothetical protein